MPEAPTPPAPPTPPVPPTPTPPTPPTRDLELCPVSASVVLCLGAPPAMDRLGGLRSYAGPSARPSAEGLAASARSRDVGDSDGSRTPRSIAGALAVRVAADEVLLVGPPSATDSIAAAAAALLHETDANALVMPMTDAWSIWSLTPFDPSEAAAQPDAQSGAQAAFERLSAVPLRSARPGFAQGGLCSVGSKVLALPDRLCLMVNSLVGHHVRDRVLQMCGDLAPEVGPTWEFELPTDWIRIGGPTPSSSPADGRPEE